MGAEFETSFFILLKRNKIEKKCEKKRFGIFEKKSFK